jgi:hypothetical protein
MMNVEMRTSLFPVPCSFVRYSVKKFLLLFYSLLFSANVFGQNLVPNPSFEVFSACPDTFVGSGGSNLSACNFWMNPGGFTPDYLNGCDTNIANPRYGVPINQYGFQYAKTGTAYSGVISSYLYTGDSVREYIEVKLLDSLIAGKNYLVSFFVSLADRSRYAANDIGVFFSDTLISMSSYPYPLPFTPQIQNNPFSNPLTDTTNWIEIKDTFTAQGGEQYILIGNFKNDANTDTTNIDVTNPDTDPWAYYYIDYVSVSLDSTIGINELPNQNSKLQLFPNPTQGQFAVSSPGLAGKTLYIYNTLGEIILQQFIHSANQQFRISAGAGVYFVELREIPQGGVRVASSPSATEWVEKLIIY